MRGECARRRDEAASPGADERSSSQPSYEPAHCLCNDSAAVHATSAPRTLAFAFGDPPAARREDPRAPAQLILALGIVPLVAFTLWFGAHSEHLQRPVAAALYWSYLVAASMAIGLYWWRRRPASRFGPLLVIFGLVTWVASWQAANAPLLFDIGVLAEGPLFILLIYLFLSFPMGRLEPPAAAWLMYAV